MQLKSNTVNLFVRHGDTLVFGSDRRVSWGFSQMQNQMTKVKKLGPNTVMTGSGSGHILQLVRETFKMPKRKKKTSLKQFMLVDVKIELFNLLAGQRFLFDTDEVSAEPEIHATILLYHEDVLAEYTISLSDVKAVLVGFPYYSGCGGHYAAGAFEALLPMVDKREMTLEDAVKRSLEIAAVYSPGCSQENDIVVIRKTDDKVNTKTNKRR